MCEAVCQNGERCKRHSDGRCWQHSLQLSVIFTRHATSCQNHINIHGDEEFQHWSKKYYTDPELTDRAIADMPMARPPDVDSVMSSTMIRAQETAMYLYPERNVTVVPYLREIGDSPESTLTVTPRHQESFLSAERRDLTHVARGNKWNKSAHMSDYEAFERFMARWAWMLHIRTGRTKFKVLVVTHSSLMMQIFGLKERPLNLHMVERQFVVSSPKNIRREGNDKILHRGFTIPSTLKESDVRRCRMHQTKGKVQSMKNMF